MGNPIREEVTTDQPCAVTVPFKYLFSEDSGKVLANIPDGAAIDRIKISKLIGFTGGATLTIGTATTPDLLLTSAQLAPASTGVIGNDVLADLMTDPTEIIITKAGTTATAGSLIGWITYVLEVDKAT